MITVRITQNSNKYYNDNDNLSQQLCDYIIRNLINNENDEIIGIWDYASNVVSAINQSNILGYQLSISEEITDEGTYYKIKKNI